MGQGEGVGADPAEIADHVHVDAAGVDSLGGALVQATDVRQPQLVLADGDPLLLFNHLRRQLDIAGGQRGDGALQQLLDATMEGVDLAPALVRERVAAAYLLEGQLHEVLVDDVADVLQIVDGVEQAQLAASHLVSELGFRQPGEE